MNNTEAEQKRTVKLADLLSSSEEYRFILPVEDFSAKQIIGNGRLRFIKRAASMVGREVQRLAQWVLYFQVHFLHLV